ncbi:NIF family HAD-type phosphatase [Gemmata sp.]|uniref:NIF family HAD-type phosphatase n=1 Tax=Gemmata sp. TaxID=1914242 RepID=UPI003F6F12E9
MSVKVLALDLERTLIDDALSGRPRPGLSEFLSFCGERFRRVAVFTTVEEADARDALARLDRAGHLPSGLLDRLEFVGWSGEFKDLAFVPDATPGEVVLVDDDDGWVRPDQRGQWVPVAAWDGGPDSELARVRVVLEGWLSGCPQAAELCAAADRDLLSDL